MKKIGMYIAIGAMLGMPLHGHAASNDCFVVAAPPSLTPNTSAPCFLNTSGEQLVTGAGGGGGTSDGIVRDGTGDTTQANVTNGRLHVDVPILTIGNFPGTQPVSASSLPLPTGAATAALQDGIIRDGTGDTTQANVSNGRLQVESIIVGSSSTSGANGQVAVTATSQALPTNATSEVCVKALSGNGLTVFVGYGTVTTSNGMPLGAGEGFCTRVTNSNALSVIASGTGSSVAWIGRN